MKLSYRALEVLPGFLSWGTLLALILLSWQKPEWTAIFILAFTIFWLLRLFFWYLHLRTGFLKMKRGLKTNWAEKIRNEGFEEKINEICHLIILPMYQEPFEVVNESLQTLSRTNYPKDKLLVVLATEERAGEEARRTAEKIQKTYEGIFGRFLVTKHPPDIPGELAGKGSNEHWAGKQAQSLIINRMNIPYENVLVSVFDVDTQVYPDYFSVLAYKFLTAKNPQRSSYQPIPLYFNNIFEAPALARLIAFSTTFWQMIQQSRISQLTTYSSHSMPFKPLAEIGFWDKTVVSEDSRIFWQCFFHYNGDWKVIPLYYPVSMDANVGKTTWQTLKNLYKQQRRWAWGVENIPYLLHGFFKNKKIPLKSKICWNYTMIEGFYSWATTSLIILFMGWLPIVLGGPVFNKTLLAFNLPILMSRIMTFSNLGLVTGAFLSISLLPPLPGYFKKWKIILYVLQWLLMPIVLIFFGSIPALEAQTRLMLGGRFKLGFWVTPKSRIKS